MRNKIILIFFLIIIQFIFPLKNSAWSESTHRILSYSAVFKSKLMESYFVKKLGFDQNLDHHIRADGPLIFRGKNKSITEWILYGAEKEDASPLSTSITLARSSNHFHNPLKDWSKAGLEDINFDIYGTQSLILWAQDGNNQKHLTQGDNSWEKMREYYHKALTWPTDDSLLGSGNKWRFDFWTKTFKALGHQIHLIQDSAVPDHARNDSHPLNSVKLFRLNKKHGEFRCIEGWAAKNYTFIQEQAFSSSVNPAVSLNVAITHNGEDLVAITQLADANVYNNGDVPTASNTQGLTEYTNGNFFSEDTIFTEDKPPYHQHWFPYPNKSSTDYWEFFNQGKLPEAITARDGKVDYPHHLSKTTIHGEEIKNFLAVGYFTKKLFFSPYGPKKREFFHDEECYKDYVKELVPRAVGYSTAMINYFFRGEIEITPQKTNWDDDPNPLNHPRKHGIYAFTDDSEKEFKEFLLEIRNITPPPPGEEDPEELKNGTIRLVIRYRPPVGNIDDPFQQETPPLPNVDKEIFRVYRIMDGQDEKIFNRIPWKHQNEDKNEKPLRLHFDLSDEPIPINATDITITVVFKGDIGHEKGSAVAIGFKDISEPTPIDFLNDSNWVRLANQWYNVSEPCAVPSSCTGTWKDAYLLADCQPGGIACCGWEPYIYLQNVWIGAVSFNNAWAADDNFYVHYNRDEHNNIIVPQRPSANEDWDESTLFKKLEPGFVNQLGDETRPCGIHRMYVLADSDEPIGMDAQLYYTNASPYGPYPMHSLGIGIANIPPFENKLIWNGYEYKRYPNNPKLTLDKGKYHYAYFTVHESDGSAWAKNQVIKKGESTILFWLGSTYCVEKVFLDGEELPGSPNWGYPEGTREVTPEETTTYTFTFQRHDGNYTIEEVKVHVKDD